uniref:Uncharacterized protein n=1 Tax=Human betaherpesvirus 6 TaxID=10368 RepID=A0A5P9S5D3_9BETA|nr:hypothetical protein [Human betaherpesvirus 6]QFX16117.1 hypothetical protein [Human betaherpesvirus 6]
MRGCHNAEKKRSCNLSFVFFFTVMGDYKKEVSRNRDRISVITVFRKSYRLYHR